MLFKKICAVAVLSLGVIASAQAADKMYDFKFQEAVNRAVADGVLDGSVKFYLAGTKSGGKVIISTGTKTLQDQLFQRDLPTVRDATETFRRVLVNADGSNRLTPGTLPSTGRADAAALAP